MWSAIFLVPAVLLMLLAVLQTRSFFEYRKRQKKKGRKEPETLSWITWLLYGAAGFLLLLGLLTGISGETAPLLQESLHTQPSTAETTVPVETTIPAETTQTVPEETADPSITLPEERTLTARRYFVYDCNVNAFFKLSGDINEKVYPASITKLFSIYVARQYLAPDQTVTVGAAVEMVAAGSSLAKLKKGDRLTVNQLIGGMMLPSGNDAAYVLAEEAGRVLAGSDVSAKTAVAAFIDEMNRQAAALGLKNTHFCNPDGIHNEDHYSSLKDLVRIAGLALQDPVLMQYAGTTAETAELSGRKVQWINTNELIQPESEYYCPYAIGLKTGRTKAAGSCLLSAFSYRGQTLIVGVFGCPKTEDRFADTLQLFNEAIGYEG